jgi:hypothetical protein
LKRVFGRRGTGGLYVPDWESTGHLSVLASEGTLVVGGRREGELEFQLGKERSTLAFRKLVRYTCGSYGGGDSAQA